MLIFTSLFGNDNNNEEFRQSKSVWTSNVLSVLLGKKYQPNDFCIYFKIFQFKFLSWLAGQAKDFLIFDVSMCHYNKKNIFR